MLHAGRFGGMRKLSLHWLGANKSGDFDGIKVYHLRDELRQ